MTSSDPHPTADLRTADSDSSLAPPSSELPEAVVAVSVATLWRAPLEARPGIDEPALAAPADPEAWTAAMAERDERLWLMGRVDSQMLMGTRVLVVPVADEDTVPGWTRVLVPDQATPEDPRGYPGWIPTRQLVTDPDLLARTGDVPSLTVSAQVAVGRIDHADGALLPLSFDTRLPLLADGDAEDGSEEVTALLPGGRTLRLRRDEVRIGPAVPATGEDVLATGRIFLGLPYLWGGTSGWGLDCSGLVGAIYRFHGVLLPRDAEPQLRDSGLPHVEREDLEVGDLVFFSAGPGAESIRHVTLYAGEDRILHAPSAGKGIEEISLSGYDVKGEYAGAIRPLP